MIILDILDIATKTFLIFTVYGLIGTCLFLLFIAWYFMHRDMLLEKENTIAFIKWLVMNDYTVSTHHNEMYYYCKNSKYYKIEKLYDEFNKPKKIKKNDDSVE